MAAGLPVWGSEELEVDLEAAGVLRMARNDIEGPRKLTAGEHEASHYVEWWRPVGLTKPLTWWQEKEGLLDGKFQVPWGIVGKKEMDTVETEASEV